MKECFNECGAIGEVFLKLTCQLVMAMLLSAMFMYIVGISGKMQQKQRISHVSKSSPCLNKKYWGIFLFFCAHQVTGHFLNMAAATKSASLPLKPQTSPNEGMPAAIITLTNQPWKCLNRVAGFPCTHWTPLVEIWASFIIQMLVAGHALPFVVTEQPCSDG